MTITKRGTKGSALTYNEMDENIRDLYEDTTINRVLENGSGSGSDVQHLTYSAPSNGALNSHTDPGYITINYNTRLRMADVNSNGDSWCCANMLDMKNHNIIGVNNITFSDPGVGEGLMWQNTRIFESDNDLTNNPGSLQIVHKNIGTPSGGSPEETYERRLTVANDHTEIRGQIQADSHQYVLVVSGEDKHNTVDQTANSGVGIKLQLANNSADGESFIGGAIVAKRVGEEDSNSSTALEFYTSDNDQTLDRGMKITKDHITHIGDGSKDAAVNVLFTDGSSTAYRGYGIEFNRTSCYIRPNSDGDKDLYLGNADANRDWRNISIKSTLGTTFTGPVITVDNLLVGTTSDVGDATNVKKVVGGVFTTLRDSTDIATGTTTTVATLPSGEGNYIVSASVDSSNLPVLYNEVAVVGVSQSTSTITTLKNTSGLNITMSGLNVQILQGSGSTQTVHFSILRIL